MSPQLDITRALLQQLAEGVPIQEAFDKVLGEGTYDRLVTELYEDLQMIAASRSQPH